MIHMIILLVKGVVRKKGVELMGRETESKQIFRFLNRRSFLCVL